MKSLYFSAPYEFPSYALDLPFLDFKVGSAIGILNDTQAAKRIYSEYDVVICPGNSFGHMTGGFDQGVVDVFGTEVEDKVRAMIEEKYFGMMPVGSSEVVMHDERAFVYTPTMMVPVSFTDIVLPYMAMYSSLLAIHRYEQGKNHQFEQALCPLFAAGTGGAHPATALSQQLTALSEFLRAINGGASNMCEHLFRDGMTRYHRLSRA